MGKIYIPPQFHDYCLIVADSETIMAFETVPLVDEVNTTTNIFINSHYLTQSSSETVNTELQCLPKEAITDEVYYRNDFGDILVIFTILSFWIIYIPIKIVSRFGRWL